MRAAEPELFRDKIELSLDGKQVFYLFFGGAVIASMVFVLGVMVGRRVEARSHADAHVASATSDPLAALDKLDASSRSDELAFRGALRGGSKVTGLGAVDAELVARAAARDGEGPLAVAKEAKAEQAKAEQAKAEQAKAEQAKAEQAKAEHAKAEQAKAEHAKAAAPAVAVDGPKAEVKAEATAKKFTLQLSSFQDEGEAKAFADELRAAGYAPYVKRADVPEKGIWYRVRVGGYPTFDEAVAAKKAFEAERGVIAYVTRL